MKRYIKSFTYVRSAVSIDRLISQFPTVDESDFDEIIRLDPTFKDGSSSGGKYAVWLLNQFSKGNFDSRDYSNIKDALDMFVKRSKAFTYSDLGRYKTVDEFLDDSARVGELPLSDNERQKELQRNVHNASDKDKKLLAKDGEWELWQPLTYEGSISLAQWGGEKAKWCTAYSGDDGYWRRYSSKGSIYIFINTTYPKQKYQSCPEAKSWFFDFNDNELGKNRLVNFLNDHRPFAKALDLHVESSSGFYVQDSKLYEITNATKLGNITVNSESNVVKSYEDASNVVLPNNVELQPKAFANNQTIKNVILPEGVETIPNGAFSFCSNLVSVKLPKSVQLIEAEAFADSGLRDIALPKGLDRIPYRAFVSCSNLASIKIPKGVRYIFSGVFQYSGLRDVVLPEGLEDISTYAFAGCPLTSVKIPQSVRYIEEGAFLHSRLRDVTLPDNVYIGSFAFAETNLVEVSIPGGVEEGVPSECFRDCEYLEEVYLSEGLTVLKMLAFSGCRSLKSINLPSSLEQIRTSCFRDCVSLTELIIPDSISSISDTAFIGCRNLTIFIHTDEFDEDIYRSGVKEIVHDF